MPEHDDPLVPEPAALIEASAHEKGPDPLPLAVGKHGHGGEPDSGTIRSRRFDRDGTEEDMSYNPPGICGHQGNDGLPRGAQAVHEVGFVPAPERELTDAIHRVVVVRILRAHDDPRRTGLHFMCSARKRRT
jgi:hypothetical protein